MTNIIDQLGMFTSMDWQNAFAQMEACAAARAQTMHGPYYFIGEIDDPFEMLCHPNVTLEMVQYAGKTNWLRDMDGNYITVDDATVDELADAGRLINGYCEAPETAYDQLKTPEERIQYRMEHQHVDERLAKELVSCDEGFNVFKYRYIVHQKYTTETHDGKHNVYEMDEEIEADNPLEALEIAKNCNGWYVGLDIRCGFDYSTGVRVETHEIIIHLDSEIIDVIELT